MPWLGWYLGWYAQSQVLRCVVLFLPCPCECWVTLQLEQRAATRNPLLCSLGGQGCDEYHDSFPEHCMTWFYYCKNNLTISISFALCLTQPLETLLWSYVYNCWQRIILIAFALVPGSDIQSPSRGGFVGFSPCPSLLPVKRCSEFSVSKNELLALSIAKDALNFAKNCFGVCNWHAAYF